MMTFRRDVNTLVYPPDGAAGGPSMPPPPLILFLHGIGERGNGGPDLARVALWGLPRQRAEHRPVVPGGFPFLVVAPQCPADRTWSDARVSEAVERLLDDVLSSGLADPRRVYLTGFSMGGIGAFALALRAPERFAAVAPVCGRCPHPAALPVLGRLPMWIAYAEDDEIAELAAGSRDAAARLAPFGNLTVRAYRLGSTEVMSAHVRTCEEVYSDPALYAWMLGNLCRDLENRSHLPPFRNESW